jgi:hypothetical protein
MHDMPDDTVLNRVHLQWCLDILKRMKSVLDQDDNVSDKLQQLDWLVKQALKVERED